MFFNKHKTKRGYPDYSIMISVGLLTLFGLIMLVSASSNLGAAKFKDSYYYLRHQIIFGLSLGIAGFFAASKIYYRRYEKLALPLLLTVIIFIALVFTPLGVNAKGASRWLALGPITFQPSELMKLAFILYLGAWLSKKHERQKTFVKGFLPFFAITSLILFLILKEPSTSTAVILFLTAIAVYFASGAKFSYIFGVSAVFLSLLLAVIYFTPYRLERVMSFIQPENKTSDSSFHINQALIAIGSGGIGGVGYGKSTTKIGYLPEPIGDSIFAVIAEEFGFIGSSALIAVFLFLILKLFFLARKCSDKFGKLVLIGFGSLLALQTFTHIAAISGLIPLTGTPLPFISYGGTALAVFLTMSGIAVNISKYT